MNERGYSTGSGVAATLFIGAGIVLLLVNFGVLNSDAWATLIRFWPILLVLWGLQIIIGRNRWSGLLVTLLGLAVVCLLLVYLLAVTPGPAQERFARYLPDPLLNQIEENQGSETVSKTTTLAEKDFTAVQERIVNVDLGIEELVIEDDNSTNYAQADFLYPSDGNSPSLTGRVDGGKLTVDLKHQSNQRFWWGFWGMERRVDLTLGQPNLTTKLDVNLGTGSVSGELNEVKLTDLQVRVGTGKAELSFANPSVPSGEIDLRVGTGSINIRLPKDVGFTVKYSVGLGELEFDNQSLRGNGTARTENFDQAATKIGLKADIGTGKIEIERY